VACSAGGTQSLQLSSRLPGWQRCVWAPWVCRSSLQGLQPAPCPGSCCAPQAVGQVEVQTSPEAPEAALPHNQPSAAAHSRHGAAAGGWRQQGEGLGASSTGAGLKDALYLQLESLIESGDACEFRCASGQFFCCTKAPLGAVVWQQLFASLRPVPGCKAEGWQRVKAEGWQRLAPQLRFRAGPA
jgi:hypothetical protein